jgi:chaperonin GroEL
VNPATGEEKTVDALVAERVEMLKKQIEISDGGFDKDKMKERLASLTDGISLVKLGANTEIERILMKRRVEDAIRAVQCAKEEGIVAGGGAALLKCVDAVEALEVRLEDPDEALGARIVKEAIQSPARRILEVAGIEPEPAPFFFRLAPFLRRKWARRCQDKILWTVRKSSTIFGYDMSEKGYHYTNLIEKGVVDPVKVVRVCFLNGGSCAKSFLSTEVAISPVQNDSPSQKR